MKRGRKKRRVRGGISEDPLADYLFGVPTDVFGFATMLVTLADKFQGSALEKEQLPDDATIPLSRDLSVANSARNIACTLACVGSAPNQQAAKFFRDVAALIETGRHRKFSVADPVRTFLPALLKREYGAAPGKKPVEVVEIVSMLFRDRKLTASERTVSDVAKDFGYKIRAKGRPKKSGN